MKRELKRMRRLTLIGMVALALAVAWATGPGAAIAGLEGSVHDFTIATGPNSQFKGASSMCSTCHVSHRSSNGILTWNHTLSANQLTFAQGAATSAGTRLPTNISSWTGTTKYCLSCHDGSVAVGNVIDTSDWGTAKITDTDKIVAPGGDLSGIHPVAVPYPDIAGATYNGITTAADPSKYAAHPTGVRLYGRNTGQKGIECGSCHEVHADNTHGALLRGGFSCTACHM